MNAIKPSLSILNSNAVYLCNAFLHLRFIATYRIADNSPLFVNVLDGIFGQVLKSMHEIQKSLQFWQSRAEVVFLSVSLPSVRFI